MSSLRSTKPLFPIIMIGGPSGIGKTTIITKLVKLFPSVYQRPISYTTRARRAGEDAKTEYIFINAAQMKQKYDDGQLANMDDVYGNLYGISRLSIEQLNEKGVAAIKEVHPHNHNNLLMAIGQGISVLLWGNPCGEQVERTSSDRLQEDIEYYEQMDLCDIDILQWIDVGHEECNARSLHRSIMAQSGFGRGFPSPGEIDALCRNGYNGVASEFFDHRRLTTRDFHTVSQVFVQRFIDNHIGEGFRCLEIGPGNAWLRRTLRWPPVEYFSADLADQMELFDVNERRTHASARALPFPTAYFDVAVASLADPFFYPTALCEIARTLKNGAKFLLTLPNREFSQAARGTDSTNLTAFRLQAGSNVVVHSFTSSFEAAKTMLEAASFSVIEFRSFNGKAVFDRKIKSPVTESAALKLGVSVDNLLMVDAYLLEKCASF